MAFDELLTVDGIWCVNDQRPRCARRRASATCTTGPTRAASFASCSSASRPAPRPSLPLTPRSREITRDHPRSRRASRPSPSRLSSSLSSTTSTPHQMQHTCGGRRTRCVLTALHDPVPPPQACCALTHLQEIIRDLATRYATASWVPMASTTGTLQKWRPKQERLIAHPCS